MADGVFNIAKGRVAELHDRVANNDPSTSALIVVLLSAAEADGTLEDYDDLAAILGAAGNTEAAFTNYARKALTDTEITASAVDDTGNTRDADIPDQTWTAAGNGTNETLAKLLVCYDDDTGTGTDSNIIPLTHHDFTPTTDGSDLTAQINATGYFQAS